MAPRQRIRQREVRQPDTYDDQKTPLEIQQAESQAVDLETLSDFLLSQVRQILGTDNWFDPVPASLQDLADAVIGGAVDQFVYNEVPAGNQDGANTVFTAFQFFRPDTIRVYFNGVRLSRGAGCDFEVEESAGTGTGFDTIRLLDADLAPLAEENLTIDYVKA